MPPMPEILSLVHYMVWNNTIPISDYGIRPVSMTEDLSVPQAASYLGVSEGTVRRNVRSKRLKAIRKGTQWFVTRRDILIFARSYDPRTGRVSPTPSDASDQPYARSE